MGDKCAAAINVLALAVALLRAISNLKAAPSVCRMSTLWAIHHFSFSTTIKISIMIHKESILRTHLFHFKIINFDLQLQTGSKTIIRADRMRQSCNGPFGIVDRLLKAAQLYWHFGVEICPALCELQGE